jgi:hypothetical protein
VIVLLAMVQGAGVSIQPTFQPPPMVPMRRVAELAPYQPLDWTCSVRPPSGPEFTVSGHFEKPAAEAMGNSRRMSLRIGGPEPVTGSGVAGWMWPFRRDGRYWFEVKTSRFSYNAEMDFIEPGKKGYIRLLSTREPISGSPTIWQLQGLGFCTTTVKREGEAKR